MRFLLLPAPFRYTPTHAPAYWVDYRTIKRFTSPMKFPLQMAVINSVYVIDSLMVAPGVLVMRTPRLDELRPWFCRVDFEEIFGQCTNVPYIPDSLIVATNVKAWEAILESCTTWRTMRIFWGHWQSESTTISETIPPCFQKTQSLYHQKRPRTRECALDSLRPQCCMPYAPRVAGVLQCRRPACRRATMEAMVWPRWSTTVNRFLVGVFIRFFMYSLMPL